MSDPISNNWTDVIEVDIGSDPSGAQSGDWTQLIDGQQIADGSNNNPMQGPDSGEIPADHAHTMTAVDGVGSDHLVDYHIDKLGW